MQFEYPPGRGGGPPPPPPPPHPPHFPPHYPAPSPTVTPTSSLTSSFTSTPTPSFVPPHLGLPPVAPSPTPIPAPFVYDDQVSLETGKRTLWVVFVIMVVASLAKYTMAARQPAPKRLFHVLTSFITTFAAISYLAMANGQGIVLQLVKVWEESHGELPSTFHYVRREVYWARYVDWSLTTPLLLLDLSFLAGLNGADIIVVVVSDLIMVLTGLFAALSGGSNGVSWGYYAIACIAYLVIVYHIAIRGRAVVANKDKKTAAFFGSLAGFTLLLWTVYPIIWGLAEGGRVLDVNGEILAYAVLDILAKPVFGFWLLFTHDAMAASSISVGGWWAHGLASEGAIRVGDDDEGA